MGFFSFKKNTFTFVKVRVIYQNQQKFYGIGLLDAQSLPTITTISDWAVGS